MNHEFSYYYEGHCLWSQAQICLD